MISTIAVATTFEPTISSSPAANHNNKASGWVNWRANSAGQRRTRWCRNEFGPYCSNRRSASRVEEDWMRVARLSRRVFEKQFYG